MALSQLRNKSLAQTQPQQFPTGAVQGHQEWVQFSWGSREPERWSWDVLVPGAAEQPQLSPCCCNTRCLTTAQQQDNSCSLALFGL